MFERTNDGAERAWRSDIGSSICILRWVDFLFPSDYTSPPLLCITLHLSSRWSHALPDLIECSFPAAPLSACPRLRAPPSTLPSISCPTCINLYTLHMVSLKRIRLLCKDQSVIMLNSDKLWVDCEMPWPAFGLWNRYVPNSIYRTMQSLSRRPWLHRLSNRFAHRFSLFPHHSFDSVT